MRYVFAVTIDVQKQYRDAANTLLESLGFGPNNINVENSPNHYTTTIPWPRDELAALQKLADEHPRLDISIAPRTKIPGFIRAAMARCKLRFDKPEYKSDAPGRTKAKVTIEG